MSTMVDSFLPNLSVKGCCHAAGVEYNGVRNHIAGRRRAGIHAGQDVKRRSRVPTREQFTWNRPPPGAQPGRHYEKCTLGSTELLWRPLSRRLRGLRPVSRCLAPERVSMPLNRAGTRLRARPPNPYILVCIPE